MIKTIFVPSTMAPKGKVKKKAIPTGNKKKVLGGLLTVNETVVEQAFVPDGVSDCQIDGVKLAHDLEQKIAELEAAGFSIINITPLISGAYASKYEWSAKMKAGYGYGYGFSYTEGLLIVARQLASHSSAQTVST